MQRGQSSSAAPGPIFSRAFRQTLIGATFPNRNSVSLKSNIVSKQCPYMSLDRKTCFGKSKTFVRQGDNVVASILRKCKRKARLNGSHVICPMNNRQDEGKSHLHTKNQLDDTSLWKTEKVRAAFARVSNLPNSIPRYVSLIPCTPNSLPENPASHTG